MYIVNVTALWELVCIHACWRSHPLWSLSVVISCEEDRAVVFYCIVALSCKRLWSLAILYVAFNITTVVRNDVDVCRHLLFWQIDLKIRVPCAVQAGFHAIYVYLLIDSPAEGIQGVIKSKWHWCRMTARVTLLYHCTRRCLYPEMFGMRNQSRNFLCVRSCKRY